VKRNLILDKEYIIGTAKATRGPGLPAAQILNGEISSEATKFYGHPCLPSSEQLSFYPTADFFRLSRGAYWGFREGDVPSTYADFGFLISKSESDPTTTIMFGGVGTANSAVNTENFIPYTLRDWSNERSAFSSFGQYIDDGLSTDDGKRLYRLFGYTDYAFAPGGPIAGSQTSRPDTRLLASLTRFRLWHDRVAWRAGSDYISLGSTDSLYELGTPEQNIYISGDSTRTSENAAFQGVLGRDTENNEPMGVLQSEYYDHAHQIWTPYLGTSRAANLGTYVKTANIRPIYHYTNVSYEDSTADLSEHALPNLYILQEAIDHPPGSTRAAYPERPSQPGPIAPSLVAAAAAAQNEIEYAEELLQKRGQFNAIMEALDSDMPHIEHRRALVEWLNAQAGELVADPNAFKIRNSVSNIYLDPQLLTQAPPSVPTYPPAPDSPPWYGVISPDEAAAQGIEVGKSSYDDWLYESVIRIALEQLEQLEQGEEPARDIRSDVEEGDAGGAEIIESITDAFEELSGDAGLAQRIIGAEIVVLNTAAAYELALDQRLQELGLQNAILGDPLDLGQATSTISQYQTAVATYNEDTAEWNLSMDEYDAIVAEINATNSDILSVHLYSLYSKLSCLAPGTDTPWMPQNRKQLNTLPYAVSNAGALASIQNTYINKFAARASLGQSSDFARRCKHIGYSQDFVENRLADYTSFGTDDRGADYMTGSGLPYGILVDFSTNSNTTAEPTDLADNVTYGGSTGILAVPGAADFLLHNIMLANIAPTITAAWMSFQWIPDSLVQGDKVYNAQYPFSVVKEDIFNGKEYFGFDWVQAQGGNLAGGTWGSLTPEGQHASAGPANLKTIDVAAMFTWCAQLRNSNALYNEAPNPWVGQSSKDNTAVAFGEGFFVGNNDINHFDGSNTNNMDAFAGASTSTTTDSLLNITITDFKKLAIQVAKLIEEKQRTYEDILNGELAYSEIIAFKVDKYRIVGGVSTTDPVQSFYFPNLTSIDRLRYLDTQIRYGVSYKYKVYAYTLVVGDQYNYNNGGTHNITNSATSFEDVGNGSIYVAVNQWPSVKIVEEAYCEFAPVTAASAPPTFPEIQVIPFRAINNKIRLLIQRQEAEYIINPNGFVISDSDINNYNTARLAQNVPLNGPIRFATESFDIETYEIYRTETKPISYSDFDGKLLAVAPSDTPMGKKTTSVSYEDDTLVPNQKYYYTCRSIDLRGNISIPTPVYEVELVDNNGMVFPIISVIPMSPSPLDTSGKPTSLTTTIKPFRRYLEIDTSFAQQAVNINSSTGTSLGLTPTAAPPSPLLNTQTEGVWSPLATTAVGSTPKTDEKVFKIRVRSKQTGKKFDLNVRFIENPIANPLEQD